MCVVVSSLPCQPPHVFSLTWLVSHEPTKNSLGQQPTSLFSLVFVPALFKRQFSSSPGCDRASTGPECDSSQGVLVDLSSLAGRGDVPMMNVLSAHRIHHRHHHDICPRPTVNGSGQLSAVSCDPSSRMKRPCTSLHRRCALVAVRALVESSSGKDDDDEDDKDEEDKKKKKEGKDQVSSSSASSKNRADLERLVGTDDDTSFSGLDLATLIRKRYGRSYDVTLIRKEFMGRNLLAMNVMWKYREQRSFPLTEEEYLLRLDDVANTLRCWGAVAHVRNTLEKVRERPRIGKAVSIFIDMDTTGGARSDEWIYK